MDRHGDLESKRAQDESVPVEALSVEAESSLDRAATPPPRNTHPSSSLSSAFPRGALSLAGLRDIFPGFPRSKTATKLAIARKRRAAGEISAARAWQEATWYFKGSLP